MSYLFNTYAPIKTRRRKSRSRKRSHSRSSRKRSRSRSSRRRSRSRSTYRRHRRSPLSSFDYDYSSYFPSGVYSRTNRYYAILDALGREQRRIKAVSPLQALLKVKSLYWEPDNVIMVRQISTGLGHDSVFQFRIPSDTVWERGVETSIPVLEKVIPWRDLAGNLHLSRTGEYVNPLSGWEPNYGYNNKNKF